MRIRHFHETSHLFFPLLLRTFGPGPSLGATSSSPGWRPCHLPGVSRHLLVAGGVVLLHVLALWALHTGLLRRAVSLLVPVQLLSESVEPPRPEAAPAPVIPQPQAKQPAPAPRTVSRPEAESPAPVHTEPEPTAAATMTLPSSPPAAQSTAVLASPASPSAVTTPSPSSTPAPSRVELPSSDAAYLQNPKPLYPAQSKRLGEQGTVLVRVLIGADGLPQRADLHQSSGFDRLDRVALATVMRWRYVPGKRAGIAETMWFVVPIAFALA